MPGWKRAANRRKPHGLELRQVLSLETLGTRGAHTVQLLVGPQAARQGHLEKLPAMLEKIHFLDTGVLTF